METGESLQTQSSNASRWAPEPFQPRPWLRGPHRQTLASALWPRKFSLPEASERLFLVEPDIRILGHCHWQPEPHAALTVETDHGSLVLDGLLGLAPIPWTHAPYRWIAREVRTPDERPLTVAGDAGASSRRCQPDVFLNGLLAGDSLPYDQMFSPEPAELIADMLIFCFGCSFTFTSVASATPTG